MSEEPVSAPVSVPWDRLVLVAGHVRGGTSWLGAMLDQAEEARYIFEPEHTRAHPVTPFSQDVRRLFGGLGRWFLDGTEPDEELARLAISWREHLAYLVRHYHGDHVPLLIIKMPRTEKLRWIVEALGVDNVIYIKRHPLGVVNSYAQGDLYRLWTQGETVARVKSEAPRLGIEVDFDRAKTWEGKLALLVHARNGLLGRVLAGTKHLVVDYEDLCFDTTSKMRAVFEWSGLEWNAGVEGRIEEMVNPATAARGKHPVQMRSARRAFAWREELAPRQIRGVQKLFEKLQIGGYAFPGDGLAPLTAPERFAGNVSRLRRLTRSRARQGYLAARRSVIRFDTWVYRHAQNAGD